MIAGIPCEKANKKSTTVDEEEFKSPSFKPLGEKKEDANGKSVNVQSTTTDVVLLALENIIVC